MTKQTFARVFKKAWEKSAVTDKAIKGFRDSGLFPFAPSKVVTTAKIEPSKVFRSLPVDTVTSRSEVSPSYAEQAAMDSSVSITSNMNASELTVHIPISTSVDVAVDNNLDSPDLPDMAISPCVPVEQASTNKGQFGPLLIRTLVYSDLIRTSAVANSDLGQFGPWSIRTSTTGQFGAHKNEVRIDQCFFENRVRISQGPN